MQISGVLELISCHLHFKQCSEFIKASHRRNSELEPHHKLLLNITHRLVIPDPSEAEKEKTKRTQSKMDKKRLENMLLVGVRRELRTEPCGGLVESRSGLRFGDAED